MHNFLRQTEKFRLWKKNETFWTVFYTQVYFTINGECTTAEADAGEKVDDATDTLLREKQ